jgi:hypothetical protein
MERSSFPRVKKTILLWTILPNMRKLRWYETRTYEKHKGTTQRESTNSSRLDNWETSIFVVNENIKITPHNFEYQS